MKHNHSISAVVWLYSGNAGWHFVTIEKDDAMQIKADYPWPRRGFGSIPVSVTIGETTWKTSIFPDKNGTYVLPLKKEVRSKESIKESDLITLHIRVEV